MDLYQVMTLLAVAAAAGWVDAVVGGGGLVLIPALLLAFPNLSPATALGTNKLAAISGTTTAAVLYARDIKVNQKTALKAGALAVPFAGLGALTASSVPDQYFRPVIMALLMTVALFVAFRPSFGTTASQAKPPTYGRPGAILLAGTVIGFYDGIFGPGTGTFLILTFTTMLSIEFIQSSAMAKVVNAGTNLGALLVFATQGHVLLGIGVGLAACNILGALVGVRMALRKGSRFVRAVLVTVVAAMVIKLAYDQFQ